MRTLSIYGQLNNKSFASSEDFDGLVSSDDAKVLLISRWSKEKCNRHVTENMLIILLHRPCNKGFQRLFTNSKVAVVRACQIAKKDR